MSSGARSEEPPSGSEKANSRTYSFHILFGDASTKNKQGSRFFNGDKYC